MREDFYDVRDDRVYSAAHVWVRRVGPDIVSLGIDDYSQKLIESVTRVDLPSPGLIIDSGQELLTILATRRVCGGGLCTMARYSISIPMPVSGRIVDVNAGLAADPTLLQLDPYGDGWVALAESADDLGSLMTPDAASAWLRDECQNADPEVIAKVRAAWSG
jgi:glycine cleavage system H protein